ncbi:hypothetical protein EVAR_27475_1 [Eumeta japonica]|uniref:Uroporphyrinogen decarboxylase (URO-D) domain-containing protein n=1 Tax=Eumeta variegata TaxID=151549 RepID=A0A4C1XDS9_EUMVA|nr:hypothetical protein EVAR_27475_1 [Eumeta japonica]
MSGPRSAAVVCSAALIVLSCDGGAIIGNVSHSSRVNVVVSSRRPIWMLRRSGRVVVDCVGVFKLRPTYLPCALGLYEYNLPEIFITLKFAL